MSDSKLQKVSDVEALLAVINSKEADKVKLIEVFEIITLLERYDYCNADEKYASLFLGSTKCGKSTTLNLLLGNVLKIVMENDPKVPKFNRCIKLIDEKGNDGTFPVIGRTTHSETTIPKKFTIEIRGIYYDLWDCSGTGDTRGAPQEIISGYLVSRLFETAKGVKLFSLFSAEALLQSNTQEFRSCIQQIQDLFGLENIDSIIPTLIFTKANWNTCVDDLKESFLFLLSEHFPNSKKLHNLFNKAKVVKIIKPVNDDVGHEYTKDHVSSLIETFDIEDFQKMKPHVAVSSDAKLFLCRSILELAIVASETMKNAYKNVYQDEMKNRIDKIFIQQCTEKEFMKLTQQFVKSKQDSFDEVSSDPSIKKAEENFDKIVDFVLTIIPKSNILKGFVETNKRAVKYYNNMVLDYIANEKYFNFLKTHSDNTIAKDELHEVWDNLIGRLKKPEIGAFSQDLGKLYKECQEVNEEIMNSHEQGNLRAEKKAIEVLSKRLLDVQNNYKTKMLKRVKIFRYLTNKFFNLFKASEGSITTPKFKTGSIINISTILDKSFSQYIEENPLWLLGDIEKDYWEQ